MIRAACQEQEIRRAVGVPGNGDLMLEGVAALEEQEDRFLYFVTREMSRRHPTVTRIPRRLPRDRTCRFAAGRTVWRLPCSSNRTIPARRLHDVLAFITAERRQRPWSRRPRTSPRTRDVSPLAMIDGDVEIGEGSVIDPFCTVGPDVSIGRRVRIHAGARLYPRRSLAITASSARTAWSGHEGFGFVRDPAGNKWRIPHLGGVVIGSHVEIGALAVVQSGAITPTIDRGLRRRLTTTSRSGMAPDRPERERHRRCRDRRQRGDRSTRPGSASMPVFAMAAASDGAPSVGMDASVQHDLGDDVVARAPRPVVTPRQEPDPRAIGFAGG